MVLSKNSLFLLNLILLSIGCIIANEPCNEYVDEILRKLKEDKEMFEEPFVIPPDSMEIKNFEIKEGFIFGLSTLHRNSDAFIVKGSEKKLKLYLGAGELKMESTGKLKKIFGLGPTINVDAHASYVQIELDLVLEPNPKVVDFEIQDVKGWNIRISGMGALRNLLYNAFVKLFGRFFRRSIRAGVEDRLQKFLEDKMSDFQIPDKCLNQ